MLDDLRAGRLADAAALLAKRPWPWRDIAHIHDVDGRLCVVRTVDSSGELEAVLGQSDPNVSHAGATP
jgi:hypothetical protein